MPSERLTADRLEGFLSFLRSVSPESRAQSEVREANAQAPEVERSVAADSPGELPARPALGAMSHVVDSPATIPLPALVEPTVGEPIVVEPTVVEPTVVQNTVVQNTVVGPVVAARSGPPDIVPEVVAPADSAPSSVAPPVPLAAVSSAGRHRPPPTGLSIRGFSLSVRRLVLLAVVTVLVVVSVVLALT